MSLWDLVGQNIGSPAVLAFVLGAVAVRLKSDLRFPEAVTSLLSTYLLLAIGLKGGLRLRDAVFADLLWPLIGTVVLGVVTPIVTYVVARKFLQRLPSDAAALAAHYGSVSAVTFTAAETFARNAGTLDENYLAALVAVLEVPGIVVALLIASRVLGKSTLKSAVHEVLTGRSVVLLIGGLVIGLVASEKSATLVEPLFVDMFAGVLVLFLLDLGVLAGARIDAIRAAGGRLIVFAVALPVLFGVLGALIGTAAGLSIGGVTVLATMAASASYIAAPAAVRIGMPEADGGLALGAALGITFPFNLVIGIPLFAELAGRLA
jgi:hypothetical protein